MRLGWRWDCLNWSRLVCDRGLGRPGLGHRLGGLRAIEPAAQW